MRNRSLIFCFAGAALFLTVCAEPASAQTPSPTITPTITPTVSPTPTISPSPSPTPTPSATPNPSATPTVSATPTPSITPGPSITPTPNPSATPGESGETLLNISTRARAQTGENVLIGGFILGNGGNSKNILVRALGPSLSSQGVLSPLLDPSLQLFDDAGQLIASNNDWMANDNEQAIVDSGLAPADPRESAILTALGPGNYTAVVTGVDGTTNNVALVEVYDLDSINPPQLLNISTRASVDIGDGQMIAGLIVGGTTAETIVFRGLGPSLSASSIADPLPDPNLLVIDGFGVAVGANNNWQDDPNASGVEAAGLAPTDALESAILVTLAPGNYTAILSDSTGATGVGLVEIYNITTAQ